MTKGQTQWQKTIDKTASEKGKKKKKSLKEKAKEYQPKTFEGLTTQDAERQEKVYKARLAQLKYLEQSGELIKVDDVKKQAFETNRKVRDIIMSIPARFSHEFAAETDPHTLEIKLKKELTAALAELTGVSQ